ncbi:KdsC family phosphatase [Leptolyngbya sp. AN03gr2]|uniref:KdsC family phosphatase n=1 Tax=unclassified Leptolyngbya TaxID=2650499 RepID=UPI003D312E33
MIDSTEFSALLSTIRLLALDVDGVMTDGGLYYTETGEELKKFNVKDGLGIQLVMKAGIHIAIVSAGFSSATLYRAKRLGIEHTFIGVEDKLATIQKLCEQLDLSLSQVAYMGDDLIDLPVLQAVGCPITVADAMPANQAIALYITQKAGGQGAVREVCDLLVQSNLSRR